MKKKITCYLIAVMMLVTILPGTAFAGSAGIPVSADAAAAMPADESGTEESQGNDEDESSAKQPSTEIVAVKALKSAVKKQSIVAYSGKKPNLPQKISVKMSDRDKYQSIKVKWKSTKKFSGKKAGIYTYKAQIDDKYTLAKGVKPPAITVKVTKCKTKINGVAKTLTRKARKTLNDTITVYNGYGSALKLQMYENGKWVTKKKIILKNKARQLVKVKYTKDWWTLTSSKWRMVIEPTEGKTGFTSRTTKVKTNRYYQNPSNYVQIKDEIKIDNSGAYSFGVGYMGLKVRAVNRYFGIGDKYWPRYTGTTKSKVMSFQRAKGLKVTGVVDETTWNAFGFSDYNWNYLGAYVSPIQVDPSSSKEDHIEAMIDRAYDYLGSDYVVGASGAPEKGADCSGLIMQALYAAGVEMEGINPVTHSWPGHEFESRNIWNYADFKKIPYSMKKRGDLIFYKGPSGYVNHIAIYLGGGKVIESWPNKVRIANVGHHSVMGVMRVFN